MRILMLTSSYPKYPGETTAPFIEEIAAGVVRRGHEVHVLAPYRPDIRREAVERGVYLHFFKYAPHPALNVWGYAAAQKGDVRLKGAAIGAVPFAISATLANLASLIQREGPFDIMHAHWVLPNGPSAALMAQLFGLPLVVSLHGSDVAVAERHWLAAGVAGTVFRLAKQMTACSGDLHDRALLLGARPESSSVIPYGVDTSAFKPRPEAGALVREELGLAPDTPIVLALGRFVYKKGFNVLLDAWPQISQQHPDARLVLAGDGDLRGELEAQARQLQIADKVFFTGMLDRNRTALYLNAPDVYVVPSIRDQSGNVDGLPNVLLEGMGVARPIVASRVAGIPQVIDDGVHGLLVPEKDPLALAQAIDRLLADRALAQRLGQAARQRIEQELTWDRTAERFEAVYQRALAAS